MGNQVLNGINHCCTILVVLHLWMQICNWPRNFLVLPCLYLVNFKHIVMSLREPYPRKF